MYTAQGSENNQQSRHLFSMPPDRLAHGTRDDGIDLLLNIEVLQFSDGRLFL